MTVLAYPRELVYVMKDFFLVLVGGICSAIGGCIAVWYQAKKARQIRMEEVRGEQQLEACKKALALTSQLWTLSIARTTDEAIRFLNANSEWFSMNQALLPHLFVENCISIRAALESVKDMEGDLQRISGEAKKPDIAKEISKNKRFIRQLIDTMDKEIRKELGLKEINIKMPDSKNEQ